jgi:hypothetical protein
MGTFVDILPPLGAQPENDDVMLYNATGSEIPLGGCVVFDETKTGNTGGTATGVADSLGFVTAVRAAVAGDVTTAGAIGCFALAPVPAGAVGRFRVEGICQVRLAADLNKNTAARYTFTGGATTVTLTTTAGNKCIAKALTPVDVLVATNPNRLCNAWVSGRHGFGGTI